MLLLIKMLCNLGHTDHRHAMHCTQPQSAFSVISRIVFDLVYWYPDFSRQTANSLHRLPAHYFDQLVVAKRHHSETRAVYFMLDLHEVLDFLDCRLLDEDDLHDVGV